MDRVGIGGIWVAVLLLGLLARSRFGLRAGASPGGRVHGVVLGRGQHDGLAVGDGPAAGSPRWQPIWIGLSVVILALWAVATILGITLPVFETGTDPTQIPVAALFAPAAAAMLTALAGVVTNVFRQGLGSGWLGARDIVVCCLCLAN